MKRPFLPLAAAIAAASCGSDTKVSEPAFPANYRTTYTEVRNCRPSGDHDLNNIRVLADPASLGPYMMRNASFPVGGIVLKEEFDFADTACAGEIEQWTVMVRQPAGSAADRLDWNWQRVDKDRKVVEENTARCFGCHTGCGRPPDGYEGTCAVP